jgi:enoyl-CoA hydratase
VLLLNRPKALNALTHGIVKDMARAMTAWENDPAVTRVIIKGAGERAFCAGGDIRVVHDLGRAGRHDEALAFWRDEYIMNRADQALSQAVYRADRRHRHGRRRRRLGAWQPTASPARFNFAMPEVGIGFFPDVGATYALPRLPFHAGSYLALTGQRIGRADALALGLATHAVASADSPQGRGRADRRRGDRRHAGALCRAARARAALAHQGSDRPGLRACRALPAIMPALEAEAPAAICPRKPWPR